MRNPTREELAHFTATLERLVGFKIEHDRHGQLEALLAERIRETRSGGFLRYLERLTSPVTSRAELRVLADTLTVNETYFFRESGHFSALLERALPTLERTASGRPLRLLSAGSSSGEEAYTLAMLLHHHRPDLVANGLTVLGIDLNATVLAKAKRALYTPWSLRQTPQPFRDRYFREEAEGCSLDPALRALVSFEQRNLFEDDPAFWRPGAFDVIFCRNVFIYFSQEAIRSAVRRFAQALSPDGFLFLGSAETLRGISQDFSLLQSHESFYYRVRRGHPQAELSEPALAEVTPPPAAAERAPLAAPLPESGGWADAIREASRRIETLTAVEPQAALATAAAIAAVPAPAAPLTAGQARRGLELALALFRDERFEEALHALPPPEQREARASLLYAAILTNRGELTLAEQVLHQVMAKDEFNAEAHYLAALCREQRGDPAGTAWHDRTAAYLDPTFAMPHLHLGLLAKRSGNLDEARKALRQAHALLPREDEGRVALFAGGFTREGMLQLCRAELQACGGSLT